MVPSTVEGSVVEAPVAREAGVSRTSVGRSEIRPPDLAVFQGYWEPMDRRITAVPAHVTEECADEREERKLLSWMRVRQRWSAPISVR